MFTVGKADTAVARKVCVAVRLAIFAKVGLTKGVDVLAGVELSVGIAIVASVCVAFGAGELVEAIIWVAVGIGVGGATKSTDTQAVTIESSESRNLMRYHSPSDDMPSISITEPSFNLLSTISDSRLGAERRLAISTMITACSCKGVTCTCVGLGGS